MYLARKRRALGDDLAAFASRKGYHPRRGGYRFRHGDNNGACWSACSVIRETWIDRARLDFAWCPRATTSARW